MRKNVHIESRCLMTSLIPSVLEEYNKEVSGYLIGSNGNSRRMKIVSAYSLQTDNRKPTWVEHGNLSAVKRVTDVMSTMRMSLVGGFHTHPEGPSKLSRSDIDFIEEKMEEHSLPHWFELITSVKKKDYSEPHRTGWKMREHINKIGLIIKPTPWTGFDVTLSGFWISRNRRKREARLWTSKRQCF